MHQSHFLFKCNSITIRMFYKKSGKLDYIDIGLHVGHNQVGLKVSPRLTKSKTIG